MRPCFVLPVHLHESRRWRGGRGAGFKLQQRLKNEEIGAALPWQSSAGKPPSGAGDLGPCRSVSPRPGVSGPCVPERRKAVAAPSLCLLAALRSTEIPLGLQTEPSHLWAFPSRPLSALLLGAAMR